MGIKHFDLIVDGHHEQYVPMDKKKVIRRIVDYLHKYASEKQLEKIAKFLGIDAGETKCTD